MGLPGPSDLLRAIERAVYATGPSRGKRRLQRGPEVGAGPIGGAFRVDTGLVTNTTSVSVGNLDKLGPTVLAVQWTRTGNPTATFTGVFSTTIAGASFDVHATEFTVSGASGSRTFTLPALTGFIRFEVRVTGTPTSDGYSFSVAVADG